MRTFQRTEELRPALATELIARASRRPLDELRAQGWRVWRFRPPLEGYDRAELGGGRAGIQLYAVGARSDTEPDLIAVGPLRSTAPGSPPDARSLTCALTAARTGLTIYTSPRRISVVTTPATEHTMNDGRHRPIPGYHNGPSATCPTCLADRGECRGFRGATDEAPCENCGRTYTDHGRSLTAPDPLTICNGCEAAPADRESPAGYCADCERDARTFSAPAPTFGARTWFLPVGVTRDSLSTDAFQRTRGAILRELAADEAYEAEHACPEWCGHEGGACADARSAIHAAEEWAENGWLRQAEAGYPGYDYDLNDRGGWAGTGEELR